MDTIILRRNVKDEEVARLYRMTGGEFMAMKDAVKANGGTFYGMTKTWLVRKDGLNALREAGYTIEDLLPFRFEVGDNPHLHEVWYADHTRCNPVMSFEYVEDLAGHWRRPGMLVVEYSIDFPSNTEYAAMRNAAIEEGTRLGNAGVEAFNKAWDGKYTKASIISAIKIAMQGFRK